MTFETSRFLDFGPFRIDVQKRLLFRDGESVQIAPKTFEMLLVLVEGNGEVVSKDDLMKRLWPDTFVEEGNLTYNVSTLRKILGESANQHDYIVTVPGKGYQFVARVRPSAAEDKTVIEEPTVVSGGRLRLYALTAFVLMATVAFATYYRPKDVLTSSTPKLTSIAVLPFKPLLPDHRDEALELGMADTLITRLSNIQEIVVRPINSVRQYTSLDQNPVTAGLALRVDSVLDGSIHRVGDRIRVTVRLTRVHDEASLWADQFDDQFTDIFTIEDRISERVAAAFALHLSGAEHERVVKRYTDNAEAYELYLKGRLEWNKRDPDSLRRGLAYFQKALEKDNRFALAYAGMADSYNLLGSIGELPMKESHPRAREAATHALEIDDSLADAHASLGAIISDYYWEWPEAERQFRRALELNPNYVIARYWYSGFLSQMGRFDEAVAEGKRAIEIDPASTIANAHLGLVLHRARRPGEAIQQLKRALEIDPDNWPALVNMGLVKIQTHQYDEALENIRKADTQAGGPASTRSLLGLIYGKMGEKKNATAILNDFKKGSSFDLAVLHLGLGQKDQTLTLLQKACEERVWLMGLLKVEPMFDELRSDARFVNLLKCVNLE